MSHADDVIINGERAMELYRKAARERDEARETLRDRFAMAAMTGVIAPTQGTWNANRVAQSCYQIADAMMVAREAE